MKTWKQFAFMFIIAVFVIVFFNTCDDDIDSGGSSNELSYTMNGEYFDYSSIGVSGYWYRFRNYSNFDVKVTVNGQTRTLPPFAPLTGFYNETTFELSYFSTTVKFSPANNVRGEYTTGLTSFYNRHI